MDQVKFTTHKGRKLLHLNLSRMDIIELRSAIAKAKMLVLSEPQGSILTLTDVTDIKFTPEASAAIKELALHNKPYVKAGAVIGVTGLRKVVFNSVLVFTGRRNLFLHDTIEDAKDWLAQY